VKWICPIIAASCGVSVNKIEMIDPDKMISSELLVVIESFLKNSNQTQIGWHYLVDLIWIYSKVTNWPRSTKILDAGGGRGPTQFLLAEMGFDVTNIDLWHVPPPANWSERYKIEVIELESYIPTSYIDHIVDVSLQGGKVKSYLKKIIRSACPALLEKRQARYLAMNSKIMDTWRSTRTLLAG
jgi:hypothetical protein